MGSRPAAVGRATHGLLETDLTELDRVLKERSTAVSEIAELPCSPTYLERLNNAVDMGFAALEKWILICENMRAELARTTQIGHTLRDMVEAERMLPAQVDCSG